MRRSNWPYRRIAQWLRANREIQISHEGVRKYCLARNIRKVRRNRVRIEKGRTGAPATREKPTKRFGYSGEHPIRTRKNH